MTARAIDYPLALAERAYANNLVPNKARREQANFDEKVREVRDHLTPLALTERQPDVLEANMVVFQRMYIVKMANILQSYIKSDGYLPLIGRAMHEWQKLETSLDAWLRKYPEGMEKNIREAVVPDALIAAQHGAQLGVTAER